MSKRETECSPSRLCYTPGVWQYRQRNGNVLGGGESLAVVRMVGRETNSNGRLMAASPALLGFAESFATWVDPDEVSHEWSHLYAEAKALIRSVKGGHR